MTAGTTVYAGMNIKYETAVASWATEVQSLGEGQKT